MLCCRLWPSPCSPMNVSGSICQGNYELSVVKQQALYGPEPARLRPDLPVPVQNGVCVLGNRYIEKVLTCFWKYSFLLPFSNSAHTDICQSICFWLFSKHFPNTTGALDEVLTQGSCSDELIARKTGAAVVFASYKWQEHFSRNKNWPN